MHKAARACAAGILAALVSFPCSSANGQESIVVAPVFSGDQLKALPRNGWPTNGGNIFNQRYSPLDQINRDNVHELKAVWRARLDGSGAGPQHSGEAQPIVYGGVVYIVTGDNDVFAIRVESGERLWKYEANLDPAIDTACCSWTSRGLGLGDGKIFVGQLDGKLVALDQTTGVPVWSVQTERWQAGYTITSAPLYYDGLVITGYAGAEYGTRGRVKAYDAEDGAHVWTWYATPEPGEPGSETWPADNDAWKTGGGTVWQTPAVDPQLGLIYFHTANPGPDFNGSERAGDNLFTTSVVALESATGRLKWYYQTVHHDIWDYDGATPVILFDTELDGRQRSGIAAASKTSWVYILDRTDGTPLIGIEERPVPQEPRQKTSPTQPIPVGDAITPQRIDVAPESFKLVNEGRIFTPYWDEPVVATPGSLGGMNWPPASYDPTTQTMYLCASDQIQIHKAEDVGDFVEGKNFLAGGFNFVQIPTTGYFAALDLKTNRLVWRQHWADTCYSGSSVTAGGLVFVGRNDGRMLALDSSDGTWLWEFQTGAGVNAPSSIFEHGGKQYVVVYSAGNLFARSPKGDSVWAFALHGTMDPVEPLSAAGKAAGVAALDGLDPQSADLEVGARIYARVCAFCHADSGIGGHDGVPLVNATDTMANARIIFSGRNKMPAFGSAYTAEEVRDLGAYVAQLAGKLAERNRR
jgi:quinohemoprotein ethanol dehydrogenase